jgi:3D (Asp-Asp-Asp) domain-containing protein
MNKLVIKLLAAFLLLLSSLFLQPFAGATHAKQVCDCEEYAAVSSVTPASRSGVSSKQSDDPMFTKYTVRSGDTLYQIARQFQTDVDSLMAFNSIADPKTLQIGQTLTISKELKKREIPAVMSIDQIMEFHLTAYTAGPESTGKSPGHPAYGITSTGTRATEGRTIAVDPRVIPYGTKVYIEGVGIRIAEDTGGAIKNNRIDVYMDNLREAINFGVKKNVRVYILSSPNA